ncbi:MAG: glycosyltransferase family 2 protein, partial [Bacteroides fragilis]
MEAKNDNDINSASGSRNYCPDLNMKPLISIIVPVYNSGKTLNRCVDSIISQCYNNFEVILIDDGSEDESGAICDNYSLEDNRIKTVHQSNHGVSYSRNTGIMSAVGDFLFFLDSDDWLLSNTLSTYVNVVNTYSCDAVIGGLTVHESNMKPYSDSFDTDRTFGLDLWETMCKDHRRFGYAGGKMIRSSIIKNNGILFNTNMISQEDVDFFLSMYEHCDCVRVIAFAGYQYDFVPGKRIPPTWDFIANQLKLLRIAKNKVILSNEAIACVYNRILSLLYSGLYAASEKGNFEDVVQRIARLDGLHELLNQVNARGEHGFVARNFAAYRYDRIRHYFAIRNRI